jgi:hypothetical protein
MFVVQASIGRNVGTQPLSNRDWTFFLNDVADVLRNQGEAPEFHFGEGEWNGVYEDSAHITVYRAERPSEAALYAYREGFSRIASHYGQDAIGLTIAESILITGNKYR